MASVCSAKSISACPAIRKKSMECPRVDHSILPTSPASWPRLSARWHTVRSSNPDDPHDRSPGNRNMPRDTDTLHGNAPDTSEVALLLIDVINDMDFPESDQLL